MEGRYAPIDFVPFALERERKLRLTNSYWNARELLRAYAQAEAIVLKAWTECMRDGSEPVTTTPGQFARILSAVNDHFVMELWREMQR